MNIFYFDEDIETCARYHCDAHVIKMILESAQILCTVLWLNHISAPYRATHKKHPCVVWANHSLSNWLWLKQFASALNLEFQYRFNHVSNHKAYDVILSLEPPPIPDWGLTERPQVMPEAYKHEDITMAYRHYFTSCKAHLGKWTKREKPDWFLTESW